MWPTAMERGVLSILSAAVCLGLILFLGQPSCTQAQTYRSTYRSSTYRSSTYRSSTYRSSTYRSSTYRSYSYGSSSSSYRTYNPSTRTFNYYRSSRRYLSYIPTISYTRSYSLALMGSLYWSYYQRYYYYSNTAVYASRSRPTSSTGSSVCANYAGGENSTYLGLFVCPLDFEPATFTACCGNGYEEYCCAVEEPGLSTGAIVGIVVGVLCVIVLLASVIFWFLNSNGKKSRVSHVRGREGSSANITHHQPPPTGPPPPGPPPGQYGRASYGQQAPPPYYGQNQGYVKDPVYPGDGYYPHPPPYGPPQGQYPPTQ